MAQDLNFRYTHVEAGLVENVMLQRTADTDSYPSGWKYRLHLSTLEDLTLLRYDNSHEDTKGDEFHTAAGDVDAEFPGMEAILWNSGRARMSTGTLLTATRRARTDHLHHDTTHDHDTPHHRR